MIILLHSSKTMRPALSTGAVLSSPALLPQAEQLAAYLRTLSPNRLARIMQLSPPLADKTHVLLADWTADPARQTPAVLSFVGDIYSGLRPQEFSAADQAYASRHVRILSGLYGVLRPADGIYPYRLEMGYRLPVARFASLYAYWGTSIAHCLPPDELIINLSSTEYSRAVIPHVAATRVVTPRFLTIHSQTRQPVFVAVHAKIARGAFARWLILNRAQDARDLGGFTDLGYRFVPDLSTEREPAFVCQVFEGLGLSIRKSVE